MSMRRLLWGLQLILTATGLAARTIVVPVPPLAWMAERVAGPEWEVRSLASPTDSCHGFEPPPSVVRLAMGAELYVSLGLTFEGPLVKRLRSLDEGPVIVDLGEREAAPHDHDHDHDHAHDHGCEEPHAWLDPLAMAGMVDGLARALAEADREHADGYWTRAARLRGELEALDGEVRGMLAEARAGTFFVNHPAFGALATRYGLRQRALETEGKEPSARDLVEVVAAAREAKARAVFVQPTEPRAGAEVVAREVGAVVVELDPMAFDYAENLRRIAQRLREYMGPIDG